MSRLLNGHNALLIGLAIMIAADLWFGLDPVLNAISIFIATAVAALVFSIAAASLIAIGWLTVKEGLDELQYDRLGHRPWRYRLIVLVGLGGILVDGVVGTWTAFNYGVRFSAAVEQIPFSGIPVYILILSYPFRWIEGALLRRNVLQAKGKSLAGASD